MVSRNRLLAAPPYPVERALKRLGGNLRTARLRRNLSIAEVADKIGAGPRAIAAAEAGKASTGIAVYAALLWVYGLLEPFTDLADPAADTEGQALALSREPSRARGAPGEIDDDF
jgi:transcriptional regulator with XRE-family HTH domain